MMSALVMKAVRRLISSITASMASSRSVRSLQSFSRMVNMPLQAPCPLSIELPVVLDWSSIWGIVRRQLSTCSMTMRVCRVLLPGEVRTSMKTVPISSLGTRPVLVVDMRSAKPAHATTSSRPASHLRRSMNSTPNLYRDTSRWNAASNAMWKRDEKLSRRPSPAL